MNWLARGLSSSVGLKFVAAVTGLCLLLFVLGHLLGNLQVFLGPEALNAYAAKLQGLGPFLWVIRGGLLLVFALHVYAVLRLQIRNWRARPIGYRGLEPLESTLASRTMIWSGLTLFAFLAYHLLHFTFHATNPAHAGALDAQGRTDVYRMVVLGFQQAPIAVSYAVAMGLLGLHLWHGVQSLFQSLGWRHPKYAAFVGGLGVVLSLLLVLGNVAMPLSVLFGLVGLPAGGS